MNPMYINPGDRVVDPLDGDIRVVDYVSGMTVFLTDGGAMGADEIERVYLPSEQIEGRDNG